LEGAGVRLDVEDAGKQDATLLDEEEKRKKRHTGDCVCCGV
jgi:hypothetical protein